MNECLVGDVDWEETVELKMLKKIESRFEYVYLTTCT